MSLFRTFLCVGGPLDGQQYPALPYSPRSFRAPILRKITTASIPPPPVDDAQALGPSIEICTYEERQFHTPQGSISVWAPADQTPLDTLMLLVRFYSQFQAGRDNDRG